VELVRRVGVVGEAHDRVFEGEQGARIHVEFDVKVDGPPAAIFRVQVNLPGLAQGVGLYEVAFIVHVESVRDRVVLKIRDKPSDVNSGHYYSG
jgi:hypothetical protein